MNTDLSDENFLDGELHHLRDKLAAHAAPPLVKGAILAAFANQHRAAPSVPSGNRLPNSFAQWFAPATAVAASVGMSIWMLLSVSLGPATRVEPSEISAAASNINAAPFIALRPLEQISLEPNPRLIETQISTLMLASMGVTVSPDAAHESVRAEMLVSAAGQPLALRFSPL